MIVRHFSYHSIYDSEYWMEKYGDPGFHRHVKLAKVSAAEQAVSCLASDSVLYTVSWSSCTPPSGQPHPSAQYYPIL